MSCFSTYVWEVFEQNAIWFKKRSGPDPCDKKLEANMYLQVMKTNLET